jgi:hypothetical protein
MWFEYNARIVKFTGEYLMHFCITLLVSEDQTSCVQTKQLAIIQ